MSFTHNPCLAVIAAKRNTVVLIVAMGCWPCRFFAGSLVGAWLGMTAYGPDPASSGSNAGWAGMGVALFVWFVLLLAALLGSDELFLGLAGAKEVSHDTYPQLFNVVEEMKIASSLPAMPRVFIMDDPAPNAFALGKSPKNCAVCVTAGLLAMCDRDELQGVIAHEIGHIVNRDALYLGWRHHARAVTIITDTLLRSLRYAPWPLPLIRDQGGKACERVAHPGAFVSSSSVPPVAHPLLLHLQRGVPGDATRPPHPYPPACLGPAKIMLSPHPHHGPR
jgi:heat shock protein HtpX